MTKLRVGSISRLFATTTLPDYGRFNPRGDFDNEVLVGPSFQFRPAPNAHFDLAPLFGCTNDSPDSKITILFGWEF